MSEKGIGSSKAMESVRLQRLIDVCDTKENTAIYLLEEWNYEPQFPLAQQGGRDSPWQHYLRLFSRVKYAGKIVFKSLTKATCNNITFLLI